MTLKLDRSLNFWMLLRPSFRQVLSICLLVDGKVSSPQVERRVYTWAPRGKVQKRNLFRGQENKGTAETSSWWHKVYACSSLNRWQIKKEMKIFKKKVTVHLDSKKYMAIYARSSTEERDVKCEVGVQVQVSCTFHKGE